MTKLLGNLASGQPVYDRSRSHLHGDVRRFLPEALGKIALRASERFVVREVRFDYIVGKSTCVDTSSWDQIVFASRPARRGMTRFVIGRDPLPTNTVTVILKRDDRQGYYVLITGFIGEMAEKEPWDKVNLPESLGFWDYHALIWGSEKVLCFSCLRTYVPVSPHGRIYDIGVCPECFSCITAITSVKDIKGYTVCFSGWGQLVIPKIPR